MKALVLTKDYGNVGEVVEVRSSELTNCAYVDEKGRFYDISCAVPDIIWESTASASKQGILDHIERLKNAVEVIERYEKSR